MPSDAAQKSARGPRDLDDVKWMALPRNDDLLLAEVGAAEAADALVAPGLMPDPIEGSGPVGHVAVEMRYSPSEANLPRTSCTTTT